MELNLKLNFKEELENRISDYILFKDFLKYHLLVFDSENNDRRNIFYEVIKQYNWIKYDSDIHDYDDHFDYVLFNDANFDKIGLYDIFFKFNGKTIIFDNETLLTKQSLINILEYAVCSSPDSCSKWPIRLEGKKEFIFNGSVIILTNQDKAKFCKIKKYEYLIRDMIKL